MGHIKRFVCSTLVAGIVVACAPHAYAASGEVSTSPNYTVSGSTVTAKDGIYQMKSTIGIGTMNVDLKNGELEFNQVSVTSSNPVAEYIPQEVQTYTVRSNAMSKNELLDTVDPFIGNYLLQYWQSKGGSDSQLIDRWSGDGGSHYFFATGYMSGQTYFTGKFALHTYPGEHEIEISLNESGRVAQRPDDRYYSSDAYFGFVLPRVRFEHYGSVDSVWWNQGFGRQTATITRSDCGPASIGYNKDIAFTKDRIPRYISSHSSKQYTYCTSSEFPLIDKYSTENGTVNLGNTINIMEILRNESAFIAITDNDYNTVETRQYRLYSEKGPYTGTYTQYTTLPISGAKAINDVTLKDCTVYGVTLKNGYSDLIPVGVSGCTVTIDGGVYTGNPAVLNGNNVVVKKGTFVDTGDTDSTFIVDADSKVSYSTDGITIVEIANPPIIIDWDDFPMPDISAPIITVTRSPADTTTPTDSVTLTIQTEDPSGNDHDTPISINGGAWQANGAKYTVTENQIVSIIARDTEGNAREYNVSISNIDSKAPEVTGWTQSTDAWTADPVKVYVEATDDVKLADAAYKFTFTPDQSGATSTATGDWQSNRFIEVTGNGLVTVTVRDSTGKQTTDSYYVKNIDRTAPTATYTLSPSEDLKASPTTGVTIELTMQNTGDPITQDGSQLASSCVKWSDAEAWTDQLTKTVYENGVYKVKVRDSVGNIGEVSITVSNISSDKPVITSFTSTAAGKIASTAPVTLTVTARAGGSTALADKPYSWDGGKTWTSLNTHEIEANGEYTVMVRDVAGTTVDESIVITNIDAIAPTAGVYLYKGLPSDFDGTDPTEDDYVWKIRVEATDLGSGIDRIETLWDSGVHTNSTVTQDVIEPGVYGAMVYDIAGNRTYVEKIVTAESIGESTGTGSDEYVEIKSPSTGSAGSHFGASINDLVYGETGAYNKSTGSFKTYASGELGITVEMVVNAKRNTVVSGYATYNGMKYTVYFDGSATAKGGSGLSATAFIPISGVSEDINNGRLVVVIQEHDSRDTDVLEREGFATFYASVQKTDPKITYSYSRETNELIMQTVSTVAGIKSSTYNLGAGDVSYTVPFDIGSSSTITLKATDNVNNTTTITLDSDTLELNGSSGGRLPTESITNDSLNSYYVSGRSSEVYIIGGTRTNTDNVPSSEVLEMILGTP